MQIRELDAGARPAWNRYVTASSRGTFFHLAEWADVLTAALRFNTHYLYAEQDGEIVGVLPLAHVRSLLFGNTLTSTPYCVYGGAVAEDEAIATALEDRAASLAATLRVDYLELRNVARQRADWHASDLYVTFRKEIFAAADDNLKAIPRKQRAMVRKGIEAGLVSRTEQTLDNFFHIYATSVRNLGTPVFSRRYFACLRQVFGAACEILVVTAAEEPVSAVMSFYFRDEVLPYYGGGIARARQLKAYDFLYWELLCRAAQRGVRVFDYGRSKADSGSYSFKKNWGFEPSPLCYQYKLVRATTLPQRNPNNRKYHHLIELWKKLPLPLANTLGPLVSRSLG